jgi:hypothetical protein
MFVQAARYMHNHNASEAEQMKFQQTKAKAITEATMIMDRLEEASPKLDAGMTPQELMKEEYLSKEPVAEVKEEKTEEPVEDALDEKEALKENRTFQIPKIEGAGVVTGVGLEIPVVSAAEAGVPAEAVKAGVKGLEHIADQTQEEKELASWNPPELEEATQIVADLNQMLQNEIDRISTEKEKDEVDSIEISPDDFEEMKQMEQEEPVLEAEAEESNLEEVEELEESISEEADEDEISQEEKDSEMLLADSIAQLMEEEEEAVPELTPEQIEDEDAIYNGKTIDLGRIAPDISLEKELEREVIEQEMPQFELTDDEKQIFSYFTPIVGMEKNLCQVLTGVRARLSGSNSVKTGNILIQGGKGS